MIEVTLGNCASSAAFLTDSEAAGYFYESRSSCGAPLERTPLVTSAEAPMRVLERSVYRGPHLYSARPMIRVRLDLGALEQWPTDRLPGFAAALVAKLPGLKSHGCSYGESGGFLRRMGEGTWLGHVIEHVAIELQALAGASVTRGKTRSTKGRTGVYDILFCYADERSGLAAARAAIALVASLLPTGFQTVEGLDRLAQPLDASAGAIDEIVGLLRKMIVANGLGPSTAALVAEARRRHIPAMRLDTASLVQFGTGSRQRRIRASVTSATSLIGAELAANKHAAKDLLQAAGLPVPRGEVVRTSNEALAAAQRLGWPVVIKPLDGNQGRGVTTGLRNETQALEAFERATAVSRRVIVEQQLPGTDHRLLVVAGELVAVAERVPAHVVGNGRHSIEELIGFVNGDPRRGAGHEAVLTRIRIDEALLRFLAQNGQTLLDVPPQGALIWLRGAANLSTGGTARDRTDDVHPDNIAIAIQAAATIGLDVAGIDMMTPDISRSLAETGGGIVEVNAAPGLRMHIAPSEGTPRDVAAPIVASLFPKGAKSRIPIFAITGTNGKTTTVRMVAKILAEAGKRVGFTTTTGVYVNGRKQVKSDASGPQSARMILRNPTVDAAVFETARGGILREGLGFDACDVGAVLNVTADHLGMKDIHSVEDLARVKSVVVESVKRSGHSILNADDPLTVKMARHARGQIVWFSGSADAVERNPIRDHIADGGMAVVCGSNSILFYKDGERFPVLPASDIPATLGGAAEFNVLNALAATAMTAAYGIPLPTIAGGLAAFKPSFEDSPGRLNIVEAHGIKIVLDYAHNPAALDALSQLLEQLRPAGGRILGMIGLPGDRRDSDLRDVGAQGARIFDEVMFREGPDNRGRPIGSINALMAEGALGAGKDPASIHRLANEHDATDCCLERARPGDIVVLTPTDIEGIWARVQRFAEGPAPERAERFEIMDLAHG
ncbi:MAG TPA: cyanophycin synthetase [Sphingopyxis sp.]|uniref:cyanophycin synthetase n=1 Tax=Sphingopyxis sp. TaxID=1908224 RepID=UPI002C938C02|nr:cyanophycin synthetase [Sphingopyxis sp.]HWW55500.1 cyanophycin synthetase [Sphingopyxis sp.]